MQIEVHWDLPRPSEGRKDWYNAISLSPFPRVRIACSKFDVSKLLHVKIS